MGHPVEVSALAVKTERVASIKPTWKRKKRRGWTLTYTTFQQPCAYWLEGGTLVIHPDLYRLLRKRSEWWY